MCNTEECKHNKVGYCMAEDKVIIGTGQTCLAYVKGDDKE